jgi:hypothetical protein
MIMMTMTMVVVVMTMTRMMITTIAHRCPHGPLILA